MPSIDEEIRQHAVARDEVDEFRIDVRKVEGYLKQLILWIRIMITVVLAFDDDPMIQAIKDFYYKPKILGPIDRWRSSSPAQWSQG